jgi:hypothetical protein
VLASEDPTRSTKLLPKFGLRILQLGEELLKHKLLWLVRIYEKTDFPTINSPYFIWENVCGDLKTVVQNNIPSELQGRISQGIPEDVLTDLAALSREINAWVIVEDGGLSTIELKKWEILYRAWKLQHGR